jgi:hypothetical protein
VTCKDDLAGEVGKTTARDIDRGPTNTIEALVKVTSVDGAMVNEMSPAVSKLSVGDSVCISLLPKMVEVWVNDRGL